MIGYGDATGKNMLIHGACLCMFLFHLCQCPIAYPWKSIPVDQPITICDVGASTGHILCELLRAFPTHQFKAIIQDMSNMIEKGKVFWEREFPEAEKAGKLEFVEIDFLKEAPVSGCDFYYLRSIM